MKNLIKIFLTIIMILQMIVSPISALALDNPTALPVRTIDTVVTGSLTSTSGAGSTVSINNLNGQATIGISLLGTFSQNIVPYGSIDGTNYFIVSVVPSSGGSPTQVLNGVGQWTAQTSGMKSFKLVTTVYTSGTANIVLRSSSANNNFSCASGCIPSVYVQSVTAGTNMSLTGSASNPVIGSSLTPAYSSITDTGIASSNCVASNSSNLFTATGFTCGTTTSATFVVPSISGTVSISTMFPVTFLQYTPISITDGTNSVTGYVNATVSNANSFVFKESAIIQGTASNIMATNAEVIVAGNGGNTYTAGSNLTLTSGAFALSNSPTVTGTVTSSASSGFGFYAGGGGNQNHPNAFAATNSIGNNSNVGPDATQTVAGILGTCEAFSQYNGTTFVSSQHTLDCSGNAGYAGSVHATSFYGSGANLTSGTVPNSALATNPLTGLTGAGNVSISGSSPNLTVTGSSDPTFGTASTYGQFLKYGYSGGLNQFLTSSSTSVNGIYMNALGVENASNAGLLALDASGNLGLSSDIYAAHGVFNLYTVSHGYGVPYDANSTGGATTHIEHGRENIVSPTTPGTCTNGAAFTFVQAFASAPDVMVTTQNNANITASYSSANTTSFTPALCTVPGGTGNVTATVFWMAVGE